MMLVVYASTVVHHIKNQSVLQTARPTITSVCLNKKCVCCSLTLPYSILAAAKVSRNGLNLHFTIYLNQSTPVKEKTGREGPWYSLGFWRHYVSLRQVFWTTNWWSRHNFNKCVQAKAIRQMWLEIRTSPLSLTFRWKVPPKRKEYKSPNKPAKKHGTEPLNARI